MGGVDSNDNSAAALLMGQLVALAAKRGMAVMIAHHAAKNRDPKSAESAMGAASFVNLSRIVLGIDPLAEKDAGKLGLPPWESKSVFRVALFVSALVGSTGLARADERLCDPSWENCRVPLISLIDHEQVGIDVGVWVIKDGRIPAALIRAVLFVISVGIAITGEQA